MRNIGIISLFILGLVLLNVISVHTIGTLTLTIGLIVAIGIGVYFLYYIALSFAALFTTIIGAIMVISLITYAAANLI
ncbi:hypothetical protein [Bacillus mycoides]|uniref:Uncharacterized protein n=1 Tax=Bacillus mycoides TaxID=1405 RepID=A0A4U3ADH6_BACMY|nr:hypothetical protein [Bacillus mycoides]TKI86506.1 hypothetical protein FC701_05490 [Bacillus mycoides]